MLVSVINLTQTNLLSQCTGYMNDLFRYDRDITRELTITS